MTTILLVVIAIEFGALLVFRIWEVRRPKDACVVDRQDLEAVVGFVIGWFPSYEDEIAWGDHMDAHDYEWYCSAERLLEQIWKEKGLRKSGGKP